MTTNTDLHGAMPELPEPYARHAIWHADSGGCGWDQYHHGGDPMPDKWDSEAPDVVVELYTAEQVRAAIQQAAVPEGLIACLRGGAQCDEDGTNIIMSRQACCEAADILERIASPAPPKQRPALGRGDGGGVPQWLPIETAPKDGTEVLGFRGDAGVFVMRWIAPVDFLTERELADPHGEDRDWQEEPDWFYADFIQGGRLDGTETPTHWRPLPLPPTTGEVA